MNQFNVSPTDTSAQHSAFHSAQSALTRKPLPGPIWAWPVLAAVAAAGLVYLVTRGPGEHAAARPAAPSASAAADAPNLIVASAVPASEPAPAFSAPTLAPSPSSAAPVDAAPKGDAASSATSDTSAKASDGSQGAVASASPATKKKGRASAHRVTRKHSARAN
jgi:hypothetical protein